MEVMRLGYLIRRGGGEVINRLWLNLLQDFGQNRYAKAVSRMQKNSLSTDCD